MAYIYREGSFYRAYEWSAWLFVRHVSNFKVTCRMFKNVEQAVAFIGSTFKNAAHRLELVRTLNGVEWINDSKATMCTWMGCKRDR